MSTSLYRHGAKLLLAASYDVTSFVDCFAHLLTCSVKIMFLLLLKCSEENLQSYGTFNVAEIFNTDRYASL